MPYVMSGSERIHYRVVGSGLPVVLHAGAGGDGRMWEQAGYVQGLAGYTCILLDHRGHGLSSGPSGIENHTPERYVEDVIAVLDAEGIAEAAFWGYSSGGEVGYALTEHHPERVAALITLGTIVDSDNCAPTARVESATRAGMVRRDGIAAALAPLEQAEGRPFPAWFWQQMLETNPEMFALEVEGTRDWHGPWSALPHLGVSVLMIAGELEDPDDAAEAAISRLRDGRRFRLHGLGHVGAFLASDAVLQRVIPFLAMIARRRRGSWRFHRGPKLD